MIKLLKFRLTLISVAFAAFGGALYKLLVIDEMSWYYTALANLIALVVNLLVSLLLENKRAKSSINYVKIFSILLFLGFITTVYMHTKYFIEGTFPYSGYDDKVSYYVKGDEYTALAIKYKQEHPNIESDADLVYEGFGSPTEKDKVWTVASIDKNKLRLISSYVLVVIFFVGIVSVLLDVLSRSYGKTRPKRPKPAYVP
jgi:hypothetical protein